MTLQTTEKSVRRPQKFTSRLRPSVSNASGGARRAINSGSAAVRRLVSLPGLTSVLVIASGLLALSVFLLPLPDFFTPTPRLYSLAMVWLVLCSASFKPPLTFTALAGLIICAIAGIPLLGHWQGLAYVTSASMGYWLGALIVSVALPYFVKRSSAGRTSFIRVLGIALVSILLLHGVGSIWLLGQSLVQAAMLQSLSQWLQSFWASWTGYTLYPIGYDMLGVTLLLAPVLLLRSALLKLTT
ncbi:MAG: biotin transporter BioY [Vampirovibrionales bacterium]|nr:biotin transporter BioY [Vampirovibrionales bacterium]